MTQPSNGSGLDVATSAPAISIPTEQADSSTEAPWNQVSSPEAGVSDHQPASDNQPASGNQPASDNQLAADNQPAAREERPWEAIIQRHSRLLMAVVDLGSHRIVWASDRFRTLVGLSSGVTHLEAAVLSRLSPADQAAVRERVRRHVLNALLAQHYQRGDLLPTRWLYEPLIVAAATTPYDRFRYVELTVSSDHIEVDPTALELLGDLRQHWPTAPDPQEVMTQLYQSDSPLHALRQRLSPETYQARGRVLIEGMDTTDRELTQQLTHLLLQRESILQPQRFNQANSLMQHLFRAEETLILTAEEATAKVFVDLDQPEWTVLTYPVSDLQASPIFQSACQGQVLRVPDLLLHPPTPCEQLLRERGMRSLLMLPLVVRSPRLQTTSQLVGLVVLASRSVDAFDIRDDAHAHALISPLTVAMRHTVQERFTNIHESVRWRFEEEAERRSLGLPPESIVFENVYPLYGISDMRGSSHERNRAIQQDLVTQFELAIQVLDAIPPTEVTAFLTQVRLDLQTHIIRLQEGLTVDAEVTLVRYLKDNLEVHFDYFCHQGAAVAGAVERYQAALDPGHGSVYKARATYDQTVQSINQILRNTWLWWQRSMQSITPHYCDIEATDGIDHMIYAGQSIDAAFSPLHLRSLRYEQLRAMCDCARTALAIKESYNTTMDITHLVLVQDATVDISHDESTERLFDVRGTRDTRYEIVKKRIDKALDAQAQTRITQPGCLTLVYSTGEEWREYQEYLRYLQREGWIDTSIEQGTVEPLQGVTGLKFARVRVLPEPPEGAGAGPEDTLSPE